MKSQSPGREREREQIERQIREFQARGGQVEQVEITRRHSVHPDRLALRSMPTGKGI